MPGKPRRRQKKPLPRRAAHQGSLRLATLLGGLVLLNLYMFLWRDGTSIPAVMDAAAVAGEGLPADRGAREVGEVGDLAAAPGEGAATAPRPEDEVAPAAADEIGRWVDGTVGAGDSLGKVLRREGLAPADADAVIRALEPNLDMRSIKQGQAYRLHFDDAGRLLEVEFHVSRLLVVRATRDAADKLVSHKAETESKIEEVEIGGAIESSLYMAFKAAGQETSLVPFFVDVFAYDLDFYVDQHKGDRFRMLVEKEYVGGEFLRFRRVLAAEYAGRAGTFRAFWWQPPGDKEGRYYSEKGDSVERTFLKSPLKFARISSAFNPKRMHPVLHVQKGHFGVDYAAPTGTPIWAAAAGTITFRARRGGAGNCVILRHDNGLETVYMHMSKFRKGHAVGHRVRPKEIIGYVGTTGLSTGPHLHFAIKQKGRYVDPMKMKMARGVGVAKKDRAAFEADTRKLVGRLATISTEPSPLARAKAAAADALEELTDDDDAAAGSAAAGAAGALGSPAAR